MVRYRSYKSSRPYRRERRPYKDSFYEELEHTFDQLSRYHIKILLGYFNAKVGRMDIFKPTIGKENLHVTSNDNEVRVLENKILRKIFVAKRDEVAGEWRKLHNAELHALYSSPDIIRNIKSRHLRWTGHVARMGESRNAYRVLDGSPEGKRSLGRLRGRWEDNIKIDLREVGYDDRD
ncbi:hypothetical protein ANN_04166 [Periplaneta americana]|uniref:Uncharacterized protein n=1 Tax=Periplaneta americana TaxID=6978 RepID=A0ABQ8T9D2_PERAM|nr:hypothetical protein ANN_04166 [Periplaneta americana]